MELKKVTGKLNDFISKLEEIGIGEIVINSLDNDGMMQGYDLPLFKKY
jgi:Imidazoleglycerol-phosphate synthase